MNFSLLFPTTIDNQYRGNKLGYWLFCLLTIILMARSLVHVFKHDGGAQSIATIPLDSWPIEAANTVIALFALWGLLQVVIAGIQIIAIVKYKALIPFLYLIMVLTQLGRMTIGEFKTVETAGTAPAAALSWYFLAIYTTGLVLSLIEKSNKK